MTPEHHDTQYRDGTEYHTVVTLGMRLDSRTHCYLIPTAAGSTSTTPPHLELRYGPGPDMHRYGAATAPTAVPPHAQ